MHLQQKKTELREKNNNLYLLRKIKKQYIK
jgi:hypothetical protein